MWRRSFLALTFLTFSFYVSAGTPDPCNWMGPGGSTDLLVVTHHEGNYFVRSASYQMAARLMNWPEFRHSLANSMLPKRLPYWHIAEFLANETGTLAMYVGNAPSYNGMTASPVPVGKTWKGETPLECLRSFAKGAGLDVAVPEEGLWVVGPKDYIDNSAVVVTAYPFDESQVPLGKATLRTVLRALPVRNWRSHVEDPEPKVLALAMGYYRIAEEASTFLFVVTNSFSGGVPAVTGLGPTGMTFKVAIEGSGRDAVVTPLWCMPGVGELMPGFGEDLDGDGIRDFLLLGDDRGALKSIPGDYSFVLSGVDGRGLVAYHHSGEIAVERKADGPKTISVRGLYGSGVEGLDKTVVLNYDEKERKFMPLAQKSRLTPSGEAGEVPRARVSPKEALATLVGGPEHVVEYDDSAYETWPSPSPSELRAQRDKTGHAFESQRSLWHLCAWNQGPGVLWRRVLVQGLRAPAEVLIQYIPEGYKRAYFEFSKELDDSVRASDLPQELRPRNVE